MGSTIEFRKCALRFELGNGSCYLGFSEFGESNLIEHGSKAWGPYLL